MIITVPVVREYMSIDDENQHTPIEEVIAGVDAYIKSYIGRDIEQATYTDEKYNGDGTDKLFLPQAPIQSITSLYDDTDRTYGAGTLIDSSKYVFNADEGYVQLVDSLVFNRGVHNVKITYVAGYEAADIPKDLKLAAMRLVASVFTEGQTAIQTPDVLQVALQNIIDKDRVINRTLNLHKSYRL